MEFEFCSWKKNQWVIFYEHWDVAITSGDDGRQTKPYERSGDEEQSHMQTRETSGNDTGYKSTLYNRANPNPNRITE